MGQKFKFHLAGKMFRRTVLCLKHLPLKNNQVLLSTGYKSVYNIENLYPDHSLDFASKSSRKPSSDTEGSFSGYIPVEELDIKYMRGSGPGGQHVNKVNTK